MLLGLAAASIVITSLFSFVLFPSLVVPLRVDYMRADGYYDIAENLLQGNGFVFGSEPSFAKGAFKREPMYPLLLAATRWMPGFPTSMVLAHILVYVATVWLAFLAFARFGTRLAEGTAAAILFAVYPYSFWYVAKPTPENLSPLLLVLNVWLCQRYLAKPSAGRVAAWGLGSAAAVLCKSNLILLFPIGLLVIGFRIRPRRKLLAHATLAAVVFAAGLSPWVVRNYLLSGRVIWGSTMSGTSFFVGNINASWKAVKNLGSNREGERAIYGEWKEIYWAKAAATPDPDPHVLEAEVDAEFDRRVLPWILRNPGSFARKLLINFGTLWFLSSDPIKTLILLAFQAPLVMLALIGGGVAWRRRFNPLEWHMLAIMAALYLSHCAILSEARYQHVLLPFTAYFAAVGALRLLEKPSPVAARPA